MIGTLPSYVSGEIYEDCDFHLRWFHSVGCHWTLRGAQLLAGRKGAFRSAERGPKRTHTNFFSVTADYALEEIPDPDVIVSRWNEWDNGCGTGSSHSQLGSNAHNTI